MYTESIKLTGENELMIVDQTLLPRQLKYIKIKGLEDSTEAIKKLKIRGAPAIGIMAAYTLFIMAENLKSSPKAKFLAGLESAALTLKNSRPTAVNLEWAVERIINNLRSKKNEPNSIIANRLKEEALKIHSEDRDACYKIGNHGLEVLPKKARIVTHCNTGSLATGGWGTALGIVYAAFEKGIDMHVFVDETRPLGQGARLTFWELNKAGIPCTLITDSMAAALMAKNEINLVLFGADRITKNGDVANKIGSYGLAIAAKYHNVPCYAVAPSSTFDMTIKNGRDIPIEQRSSDEILKFYDYPESKNLKVANPAFDVTPSELFTGIITEKGIIKQPLNQNIKKTINFN